MGVDVHLDRVPLREPDLDAWEIMISESQERMVAVVAPELVDRVREVCERWELPCTVIGEVTGSRRAPRVPRRRARRLDPRRAAHRRVPALRGRSDPARGRAGARRSDQPRADDLGLRAVRPARRLAHGAPPRPRRRRPPDRRQPAASPFRSTGPRSAAATRSRRATAPSTTSALNVACAGGEPLALTDCLNFGNPEKPEIGWELAQAIDGIAQAANELGIPVVSGNVSLYNETGGRPIPPTPVVGCVGLVRDVTAIPSRWTERRPCLPAARRRRRARAFRLAEREPLVARPRRLGRRHRSRAARGCRVVGARAAPCRPRRRRV